jgi:serine phosphatase RsbU (regulator of sigma subunit)
LKQGDRIFFYTDGLIETGGSYEDGLQRLVEACVARRSLPLRELVAGAADGVMENLSPADDTLLVGVER